MICLLFYSSQQTNQIRPFDFWENLRLTNLLFGFIWPLTCFTHITCQIKVSLGFFPGFPIPTSLRCTYPHPSCTVNVWMKSASTQTWMCGNACGLTDSVRPNFIKGLNPFWSRFLICKHHKGASSNMSHLEASSRFYRPFMEGKFNVYLLWVFKKNLIS